MPILSPIGRKAPQVRLLIAGIYAALLFGGATMVYPFLLMLAGSTRSAVDAGELSVAPRFLFDDGALYRKHAEALFNEFLDRLRDAYGLDLPSFAHLQPPAPVSPALLEAWEAFLRGHALPNHAYGLGHLRAEISRTQPLMLRRFKRELSRRYRGDLDALNRDLGAEFADWRGFLVEAEHYLPHSGSLADNGFMEAFFAFKRAQPKAYVHLFSVNGYFKNQFIKPLYTRDIAEYNRAHGTRLASYDDLFLTRRAPEGGSATERADWERFVREALNLLWVRVDPSAEPAYRGYLRAKYGDVASFNRLYGASHGGFDAVALPPTRPAGGLAASDWETFIAGWKDPQTGLLHQAPAEALEITSTETAFADCLLARHGSLSALNQALGTDFRHPDQIGMPQQAWHYQAFLGLRGELRREFALRNFATVLDYMVHHGRGVANTLIYCALAVLSALVVNPLGAYAMSRYRMPSTYKLLLFMLMVMAFPPMVTQIPVFLMLRDLNLLNTFAALVLPGMAHGYSILLLKGFFDALPRDLYDSARMDGASEWTLFWNITLSLSKPILAVIGLQAFNLAYANFMFALLLCQDQSMWTLMVWLYQLQQTSGPSVVQASLILAAIPTFIVFLLAQKLILRGIVAPSEK